jgi:hypothetical protein
MESTPTARSKIIEEFLRFEGGGLIHELLKLRVIISEERRKRVMVTP